MMDHDPKDTRYEQMYEGLRVRAEWLHERNKKQVKIGSILLLIMPVILLFIRWITDSDKVVFLLIWVFCVFAIGIFLISVEYADYIIQKTMKELTDQDEEFDRLIPKRRPGHEKFAERMAGFSVRTEIQNHMEMYGVKVPEPQAGEPPAAEAKAGEANGEDGDVQ